MARAGYCKHGNYVGQGDHYMPCWECKIEADNYKQEQARQEEQKAADERALDERIRRIVREELDKR